MIERGQPKILTPHVKQKSFLLAHPGTGGTTHRIKASGVFALLVACFSAALSATFSAAGADLGFTEVAAVTLDGQGRDASAEILAIDQRSNTVYVINSENSTLERFTLLHDGQGTPDPSYELRPLSPINLSLGEGKALLVAGSV
ncbi:MAG: hypothetical protein ACO2ZD_08030, partial [Pseudomonadales bacterium]